MFLPIYWRPAHTNSANSEFSEKDAASRTTTVTTATPAIEIVDTVFTASMLERGRLTAGYVTLAKAALGRSA
jgi:hypothetical protein